MTYLVKIVCVYVLDFVQNLSTFSSNISQPTLISHHVAVSEFTDMELSLDCFWSSLDIF